MIWSIRWLYVEGSLVAGDRILVMDLSGNWAFRGFHLGRSWTTSL